MNCHPKGGSCVSEGRALQKKTTPPNKVQRLGSATLRPSAAQVTLGSIKIMKEIELANRLKHYLKSLGYYTLGVAISCVIGYCIMFYNAGFGFLCALLLWVFFLYRLHLSIGAALIESELIKRIVIMLPIIALSTALLTLKIYVNESNPFGGHSLIPERERLFNYFLFSVWTIVMLWEFYYILLSWLERKNNRTLTTPKL
jgi:hypothetical protein